MPAGAESGHGEGDEDQDQQPEDAPKNAAGAASLAHFESIFFFKIKDTPSVIRRKARQRL